MEGATDNAGMWEGLGITQSQKDRQIKDLSFSRIKDTNRLNVGSITGRAHVGPLSWDHTPGKRAKSSMKNPNRGRLEKGKQKRLSDQEILDKG